MTFPDLPGPLHRRGPRPLLLHLGLAMLRSSTSGTGWRNSKPGSPDWKAIVEQAGAIFARLAAQSATENPAENHLADLAQRLGANLRQNSDLIAGIAAYRRHPWHRTLADPPTTWEEGGSRLLDYAQPGTIGPTVLFVPSLVNRATILDLSAEHSMLRFLARNGVRPLLLDWGWPGPLERTFTLTDYVAGRLARAMEAAHQLAGGPVVLAGYCMGGTLAVAAAQRQPDLLRGLALLATPWDFHAGDPEPAGTLAGQLPLLEPLMALSAALPVDALQTLFTLLDPDGVAAKYRAFARLDPESDRARLFVALEDWLNDGVPLAAPVARECLTNWYGANQPMRGAWHIAGAPIDPRTLRLPCFIAAPARDRIVPPESARPLASLIRGAEVLQPAVGHIGMVAGSTAETVLWRPLLNWLRAIAICPVRCSNRGF